MKSKLLACFFISSSFFETTTSFAPSRFASSVLPGEVVKSTTSAPNALREFHAPCDQARRARRRRPSGLSLHLPVPQRRVGRDAGAQQRRGRGEIELVGNAEHECFIDDDALRVAAVGVAAGVFVRAVVGERRARRRRYCSRPSLQFGQVRSESTMQPTAARSPSLKFFTLAADFRHAADDLVPGHARVNSCRPTHRARCADRNGRRRRRGSRSARRSAVGSRRSNENGASGELADCAA